MWLASTPNSLGASLVSRDTWSRRKVDDWVESQCRSACLVAPRRSVAGNHDPVAMSVGEPSHGDCLIRRQDVHAHSGSTRRSRPPRRQTSARSQRGSREPDQVELQERRWISQSVWREDAVIQAGTALRHREDVPVSMELVVYYQRGDNTARLHPDVQVVFGVGRGGSRSSYKVWGEG